MQIIWATTKSLACLNPSIRPIFVGFVFAITISANNCAMKYHRENTNKQRDVSMQYRKGFAVRKSQLGRNSGNKKYCALNDLKYFHTCQNFCVDIMHDLNEGVIPFFSQSFVHFHDKIQNCIRR